MLISVSQSPVWRLQIAFFVQKQHKHSSNDTEKQQILTLKQQYVNLTATCDLTVHVNTSSQNSNFSQTVIFYREIVVWFSLWCLLTALSDCSLLFSWAVTNNDPPLQLQSAGSLCVAFRNLRESQSWGRAVVGHQREKQGTCSLKYDLISLKLVFCVTCYCASFSFVLWSYRSRSKLHSVALRRLKQHFFLIFHLKNDWND